MAKESSEKKEKSGRKEKKEKRSETEGVHKSKKDKKDKKDQKSADDGNVSTALMDSPDDEKAVIPNGGVPVKTDLPLGALVPFANPLAGEKAQKKVLKSVKKAAKNKTLKRGVKEVVKSLRKSAAAGPGGAVAPGIVVLAADISPMDVISHIPVLCEDHGVPYIYVTSRAELGMAGSTKRPTSVVMVSPERQGKKKAGDEGEGEGAGAEGEEDFKEVYKELMKVVEKESRNVRI